MPQLSKVGSEMLDGALPALDGSSLTGVGVDGVTSSADATAMTITSDEKVGIGITNPNSTFVVSDGGAYGMEFYPNSSNVSKILAYDRTGSAYRDFKISGNQIILGHGTSGSNEAMRINADGIITKPKQPYYLAWGGNQPNSVGTGGYLSVTFTGRIDTGSNVSSNTFTAPVTGKYLICASVHIENLTTAATAVSAAIVTSNRTYGNFEYSPGSLDLHTYHTVHQSVVADMDAADTAYINCRVADMSSNTADVGSGNGYHWWTVTLIT